MAYLPPAEPISTSSAWANLDGAQDVSTGSQWASLAPDDLIDDIDEKGHAIVPLDICNKDIKSQIENFSQTTTLATITSTSKSIIVNLERATIMTDIGACALLFSDLVENSPLWQRMPQNVLSKSTRMTNQSATLSRNS